MLNRARRQAAENAAAERRHREEVGWARKAVDLARQNRNLQLVAIMIALAAIVISAFLTWPQSPKAMLAHARITLVPFDRNALIPRQIRSLPSPPPYPAIDAGDHCPIWWKTWFPVERAAPDADPLIEVSAPKSTSVTITEAQFHVYRVYRPTAISYVQCVYGAGPEGGTLLFVNLNRPNATPTIVSDMGTTVRLSMPVAVINVGAGHTEYIEISPSGSGHEIYAWSITLTTVVDQHAAVVHFGSPQDPLRSWFGPLPRRDYDYSFANHKWQIAK
jgi:hypothetical protein